MPSRRGNHAPHEKSCWRTPSDILDYYQQLIGVDSVAEQFQARIDKGRLEDGGKPCSVGHTSTSFIHRP